MTTRWGIAVAGGIALAMAACGGANGSDPSDGTGRPEGITLVDLPGVDVPVADEGEDAPAEVPAGIDAVEADQPPVGVDHGPAEDVPPVTFDIGLFDVHEDVPSDPGPVEDVPPEPGLATKGYLYPHTSDTLYRWAPNQVPVVVGKFSGLGGEQMTDLAIDYDGRMYGVTFNAFYKCDAQTAACVKLATLDEQFNGLTLVPAGTVDTDEALIAISNAGGWFKVTFNGPAATLTKLGEYGNNWQSAGDAYSIIGIGTYAAVKAGLLGATSLVKVDPKTGKASGAVPIQNATNIYGLAGVGTTAYAFSETGTVFRVEPATGKTQVALTGSIPWWGAAVSTRGK